jgi:hypothetical protein
MAVLIFAIPANAATAEQLRDEGGEHAYTMVTVAISYRAVLVWIRGWWASRFAQ